MERNLYICDDYSAVIGLVLKSTPPTPAPPALALSEETPAGSASEGNRSDPSEPVSPAESTVDEEMTQSKALGRDEKHDWY